MLYFVATPIGNLDDMSFRAIETLKNVDLIACEDTRHSLKLLNHYEIKKPLIAFHKFNEKKEVEYLVKELENGKNIAVDAEFRYQNHHKNDRGQCIYDIDVHGIHLLSHALEYCIHGTVYVHDRNERCKTGNHVACLQTVVDD